MGNFRNDAVDPWDSDQQYYYHVESNYYSGTYDDLIAPDAENFPPTSSTRVFLDLPLAVDVSDLLGTRPINLYDVTAASLLTRTTGTPGSGEYRIVTDTDSIARQKIEIHTSALSHQIGYDYYGLGGVLSEDTVNALVKGVTTIVIASSNSDQDAKTQADFIIDISDDAGAKINSIATGFSNGGTIKAMTGTYNVSTIITLASSVNLIGEGYNTWFVKNANIANVIDISSRTTCILSSFYVNGNKATYATTGDNIKGPGFGHYNHKIERITCINSTKDGINGFTNVSGCSVASCDGEGFFECEFVVNSYAISNGGHGFQDCVEISNCRADSNTQHGFNNCDSISSCIADSNTTNGFHVCNMISSCKSSGNSVGFQGCSDISSSLSNSNTSDGYNSCNNVSGCRAGSNQDNGFDNCEDISGSLSTNNEKGFENCINISASKASSNNDNGFDDCSQISASNAEGNGSDGFDLCQKLTANVATSNTGYGFNTCNTMGFNQSSGNTAGQYNASYADSATTYTVADTATGGYNY